MATLVTGGTGFVGSNIVKTLAQRGHEVVCFDLRPPDALVQRYFEAYADRVTPVQGNILNMSDLEQAVSNHNVTKIVHAAVFTGIRPDIETEQSRSIVDINVTGTANLLDLARRAAHREVSVCKLGVGLRGGSRHQRAAPRRHHTLPAKPICVYQIRQ